VKTLTKDEMLRLMQEFDEYAAKAGPDVVRECEALIDEMGELV
jgi:hypothetical protein